MNVVIDIRDIREITQSGRILGTKHVLIVMLEFCIDIKSHYLKKFINENFNFIFYCSSYWDSALATLVANNICFLGTPNLIGGYNRCLELNDTIEEAR